MGSAAKAGSCKRRPEPADESARAARAGSGRAAADAGARGRERPDNAPLDPGAVLQPVVYRILVRRISTPTRANGRELWEARLEDGLVLVARSKTPFFDGARAMLSAGFDPGAATTMRHIGSPHDSFEPISLAAAAGLAVTEAVAQSVRIRAYRPFGSTSDVRGREEPASGAGCHTAARAEKSDDVE
jgi:hypothetical protein